MKQLYYGEADVTKRKRELEKLLPLDVAADCLGLSIEVLTTLIENGTINANEHEGEILVPETEIGKVTREKFRKLRGEPITIMQAVEKYEVPYTTLVGWVHSPLGLIKVIKPGYGMQLDEADVAYCSAVYKMRGKTSRLFDDLGRPYHLKRPELKEYRQRKASQEQRVSA